MIIHFLAFQRKIIYFFLKKSSNEKPNVFENLEYLAILGYHSFREKSGYITKILSLKLVVQVVNTPKELLDTLHFHAKINAGTEEHPDDII